LKNATIYKNISDVFGVDIAKALLPLNLTLRRQPIPLREPAGVSTTKHDGSRIVTVEGFISRPELEGTRQTPKCHMIFVNSRPCKIPRVTRVFEDWYKGNNTVKPFFLMIDIKLSTHGYDINVSPSKETILLHDEESILDLLNIALDEQVAWPETHAPHMPSQLALTPVEEEGSAPEPLPDEIDYPSPVLPDSAKAQEIREQNSERATANSRQTSALVKRRALGSKSANRKYKNARNMNTTQAERAPSKILKIGVKRIAVHRVENSSEKPKGDSYSAQYHSPNLRQTGASTAITQPADAITIDSEESEDTDSGVMEEEASPAIHPSVAQQPSNAIRHILRSSVIRLLLGRFRHGLDICVWCNAQEVQNENAQCSCRSRETVMQHLAPLQSKISKVAIIDSESRPFTLSHDEIGEMRIFWRDPKNTFVSVLVNQSNGGTPAQKIPVLSIIKLQPLELTHAEEAVIKRHIVALWESGIAIEWNDAAPEGSRCSLISKPKYGDIVLDQQALKRIILSLSRNPPTPVRAIASVIQRLIPALNNGSLESSWGSETVALRLCQLDKLWRHEGEGVVGVNNEVPRHSVWTEYLRSRKAENEGAQDSRPRWFADSKTI